ncbi:MAG TPA: hypothetical protein VMY36_00890 [Patescibacteria group bacterium]|nr:hypothetical protein [Patescibacteria group bacterium]
MTATIIYYTSNQEHPEFENRIKANILKVTDLPIISVSQEPINFGKNICIGNVGASNFNMFRQIQIGCQNTKADFVISAEADCMYPPDYFTFRPRELDRCYRNSNVYVMGDHRNYWFYKKEGATHAQVIGRKYYLKVLGEQFKGLPQWSVEEKNFPKERTKKDDIFDKIYYWKTKNPVFQVKTHRSMRYYTHSERAPIYDLPYWGNGKKVRASLMKGVKEIYKK